MTVPMVEESKDSRAASEMATRLAFALHENRGVYAFCSVQGCRGLRVSSQGGE